MYRVLNPATGEIVREYQTASDKEIRSALERSDRAFTSWSEASIADRTKVLFRLSELYKERSGELSEVINMEMGKSMSEAKGETVICSLIYKYFAENAEAFLADEPLKGPKKAEAHIQRRPVGSVLGIMPWNFPYYQVARFAAPNLALGNTIILKHAPSCPRSAEIIEQMFHEAGLPEDAYINIYATNDQVSDIILPSPLNHGVSLTGSERAGSAVAAAAGRNLKKVVLELGGSDPYIVLDSKDLNETVSTAFKTRMTNNGQACNGPKRMIVMDDIYDEFVAKMTATVKDFTPEDPYVEESELRPMASSQAADQFIEQVKDTVSQGANLHAGGERYKGPGAFVQPVVLTDVKPEMRGYYEELFGPALIIFKVSSEQEAVSLANDTPYGLGAAVFSTDPERAMAVGDQLETGMVFINSPEQTREFLPFGGVKRSGLGRELGPLAMDEFVNKKLVYKAETIPTVANTSTS
jgi:succinate-semialdehyde dehydrogenase/glutarate-semialdehyde dehydrogenase